MGKKKHPSSPSPSSSPSKSPPVSSSDLPGSVTPRSPGAPIDQVECSPSCESSPDSATLSAQATPYVEASPDLSGLSDSDNLASMTVASATIPGQSNPSASSAKTTSTSDLP
ncbi:hypothetical protein DY000_02011885 [Brassica cretica]|uniref:REJ domain-containing protein n=1 Tax=Brassica cretica TaxID=69181 RepID=A0ABQ7D697_BRACR|nr:hypothetical protein DY000_02011885 [Brassica cretica]